MGFRRERSLRVLAAACAGIVAWSAGSSSRAATATWDNGGGNQLWSNNTNWNPDAAVDGGDARFNTTSGVTTQGTVTNIVDADKTALSLSYSQNATTGGNIFHTTQINDGVTLTLNGTSGPTTTALQVGSTIDNLAVNALTYTTIKDAPGGGAGGTLKIDNAAADMIVRQTSSNTAGGSRMATLDMFGLTNFNANIRNLNIAVGDASGSLNRAVGTLILAKNNTINANSIVVGFNPQNGTTVAVAGKLVFGQTNLIQTNSISIGGRVTPGNQAGFNSAVSNGSLVIRGQGGIGRSDLLIGTQPVGDVVATSNTNNVVDLAGGERVRDGDDRREDRDAEHRPRRLRHQLRGDGA